MIPDARCKPRWRWPGQAVWTLSWRACGKHWSNARPSWKAMHIKKLSLVLVRRGHALELALLGWPRPPLRKSALDLHTCARPSAVGPASCGCRAWTSLQFRLQGQVSALPPVSAHRRACVWDHPPSLDCRHALVHVQGCSGCHAAARWPSGTSWRGCHRCYACSCAACSGQRPGRSKLWGTCAFRSCCSWGALASRY